MDAVIEKSEGLRDRKRRETRERIAETGFRLFLENGYEATTLDAIAAAAGISRRTFFYYFKSKEDVLLARRDSGFLSALRASMLGESPEQSPFAAARECLLKVGSHYETKDTILVDRLLNSTPALQARKDAIYMEMERVLLRAMGELWPAPEEQMELRLAAMIAVGALRLAMEDWRKNDAAHPMMHYLSRNFALLSRPFPYLEAQMGN